MSPTEQRGSDAVDDPTEAELRAVFGPRANYYLAQWRGTARRGYNWAPFWFGGLWFAFRRMYRGAAVFWGVAIGITICLGVIFGWETPKWLERTTGILVALVCGAAGNIWYFRHVCGVIAATRALGLAEQEHLAALCREGGTRIWHAAASLVLVLLVIVAGVFLVAIGVTVVKGD